MRRNRTLGLACAVTAAAGLAAAAGRAARGEIELLISPSSEVTGTLAPGGDSDDFRVALAAGTPIDVTVRSRTSGFSPRLRVLEDTGDGLEEVVPGRGALAAASARRFTLRRLRAPRTAEYVLRVEGGTGTYSFRLRATGTRATRTDRLDLRTEVLGTPGGNETAVGRGLDRAGGTIDFDEPATRRSGRVAIPEGALRRPAFPVVLSRNVPWEQVQGDRFVVVSPAIEVFPSNLKFRRPATLRLDVDERRRPRDVVDLDLRVLRIRGTDVEILPRSPEDGTTEIGGGGTYVVVSPLTSPNVAGNAYWSLGFGFSATADESRDSRVRAVASLLGALTFGGSRTDTSGDATTGALVRDFSFAHDAAAAGSASGTESGITFGAEWEYVAGPPGTPDRVRLQAEGGSDQRLDFTPDAAFGASTDLSELTGGVASSFQALALRDVIASPGDATGTFDVVAFGESLLLDPGRPLTLTSSRRFGVLTIGPDGRVTAALHEWSHAQGDGDPTIRRPDLDLEGDGVVQGEEAGPLAGTLRVDFGETGGVHVLAMGADGRVLLGTWAVPGGVGVLVAVRTPDGTGVQSGARSYAARALDLLPVTYIAASEPETTEAPDLKANVATGTLTIAGLGTSGLDWTDGTTLFRSPFDPGGLAVFAELPEGGGGIPTISPDTGWVRVPSLPDLLGAADPSGSILLLQDAPASESRTLGIRFGVLRGPVVLPL